MIFYIYLLIKYGFVFYHMFFSDPIESWMFSVFSTMLVGAAGSSFWLIIGASLLIDLSIAGSNVEDDGEGMRSGIFLYVILTAFVVYVEPWINLSLFEPSAAAGIMTSTIVVAKSYLGGFATIITTAIPYGLMLLISFFK